MESKEKLHLQGNQHQGLFYCKPLSITYWGKHAMEAAASKQLTEFLSEAVNASLFLMTIWDGTFQKEEERPTNKYMTSRKYTSDNWCGNS